MEIDSLRLIGRIGSFFRQPVRPAQPPPGETVFVGRLATQAQIDAANAHHDALAIRDCRESGRISFAPRTPR